jgi:hypothetical protein
MGFNIHILSVRNRSTNLPSHAALAASFNPDSVRKPQTLVLDLSVRSIVSPFVFLMPTAGAVFVLDRGALPWRPLLLRCSFRGRVSRLAGRKRLREDVADFIGPTPVVLDDRVTEMAHGPNLLLIALAPTRPSDAKPIWRLCRGLAMGPNGAWSPN